MGSYRYCTHCGTALVTRTLEGRPRALCPACGRVHYEQLKVGAGALVEQAGKLLLLERGIEPYRGHWNIPAGYAEANEHPRDAARREVFEETGLTVAITTLADVFYFDDDPRGNGLLILYRARVTGGVLRGSSEGERPTFFAKKDLPTAIAGAGHDQAVAAWLRGD